MRYDKNLLSMPAAVKRRHLLYTSTMWVTGALFRDPLIITSLLAALNGLDIQLISGQTLWSTSMILTSPIRSRILFATRHDSSGTDEERVPAVIR